jgi:hypothetical protein
MPILLTFLACTAGAAGDSCRRVEVAWQGTGFECMLFGQQELARWAIEHPQFEIRGGHRCTTGRPV